MFAVCPALGDLSGRPPFRLFHSKLAEHFDAADVERLDSTGCLNLHPSLRSASDLAAFVAWICFSPDSDSYRGSYFQ